MHTMDTLWADIRRMVRALPTATHREIGRALADAAADEVDESHRAWGYSDLAYALAAVCLSRCRRHLSLLAGMLAADQIPGPAQTTTPPTDETGLPGV